MSEARGYGRAVLVAAVVLCAGAVPPLVGGTPAGASPRQLLARSDFPKGWTVSPTVGSGAGQPVAPGAIAACARARARTLPRPLHQATSPEFDQAATERSVDEEIVTYPTKAGARAPFGVVASPHAPACAAADLNRADRGAEKRYTVGRLTVAVAVAGAQSTGLAISIAITGQGVTVSDEIDDVVLVVGRSVATLTFTSVGSAFPLPLVERLAERAARQIG